MSSKDKSLESKVFKTIIFTIGLILFILIVKYAINVFLLIFAAILFAMLLHAVGSATKKMTHLPYPLALGLAVAFIVGLLTLTFWLYSPLIAEQLGLLLDQLPEAMSNLRKSLTPYLGSEFLSKDKIQHELSLTNQKVIDNLVALFSFTVGSIISLFLFLIIGFYIALNPKRYVLWLIYIVTPSNRKRVWEIMEKIGQSLRWWLLGKFLSMAVIGLLAFIGLSVLHVSLAFILGLIAALFAFIPYVGAILSAIPAILIAFANSPLQAFYVTLLYIVIHIIEGYFITPYIEQRTVSIPPALTIMMQVLMLTLIGAAGLALATPLTVVALALIHYSQNLENKKAELFEIT